MHKNVKTIKDEYAMILLSLMNWLTNKVNKMFAAVHVS